MVLPEDSANHDGLATAPEIRDETRRESTDPGTEGHGGGDSTLSVRVGTRAFPILHASLIEVALVLVCAENGRHGGDIETEEATSNDGDGGDEVDVSDGHGGGGDSLFLTLSL
jgi:hypothetical protein